MKKLFFLLLFAQIFLSASTQPGQLDPSFANKGILIDNLQKTFNFDFDEPSQILVQQDGKILPVLVYGVMGSPLAPKTAIARHLSNGFFDNSFGVNGFAEININATKALLQGDDKILVAGNVPALNGIGNSGFHLRRLTKEGMPDPGFGQNGTVMTDFGAEDEGTTTLALLNNGKILVAGYSFNGSYHDFALAKYNSDGSLDHSFSGDGKLTIDFGEGDYRVNDMLVQGDGKIIIAGYAVADGINKNSALARLHPDGRIDRSFGDDGVTISELGRIITSVKFQPDGKIIALVEDGPLQSPGKSIIRFLANGIVDQSFGENGKIANFSPRSIAVEPDGKLAIVGGYPTITASRFTIQGKPDVTFGNNGTTPVYDFFNFDYGSAVAVQSNGSIIAAGRTKVGSELVFPKYDYRLLRYSANGMLDANFGNSGVSDGFFPAPHTAFEKMVIQPDGKILVAGEKANPNGIAGFLARYNPDGSVDKTFSEDGELKLPIAEAIPGPPKIGFLLLQMGGKILIGSGDKLYRYNTDGTLDQTFGTNGVEQIPSATDAAVQSTNKIIVSGRTSSNIPALFRYDANGGTDHSFGNAGVQELESEGKIIIQPDNKIVIANINQQTLLNNAAMEITRYLPNGGLDNSFDGDGKISTPLSNFTFGATVVQDVLAIQSDGKFIIATQSPTPAYEFADIVISRYNSNGTPDGSFGESGTVTTDFGDNYAEPRTIAIGNNRLYVAGSATYYFRGMFDTARGIIAAYQLEATKPSVSISDATAYERDGWANLTITLSQAVSQGLMLHYQTIDGSASHYTNDYRREVGAVFIPAGKTSAILRLKIHRDKLNEPAENFTVQLSLMFAPKGLVTLSDGTATVTILDGKNPDPKSAARMMSTNDEEQAPLASVIAYPNPSSNYFNIVLQGSGEQAYIKVSDAQGRVVEAKNAVASKGIIQLGANYRPGVYYIEITQGTKKQTLKVIKLK